jgi:hypothetical protein
LRPETPAGWLARAAAGHGQELFELFNKSQYVLLRPETPAGWLAKAAAGHGQELFELLNKSQYVLLGDVLFPSDVLCLKQYVRGVVTLNEPNEALVPTYLIID